MMVIYKMLDEHNKLIELVKNKTDRDNILAIDNRYSYATIIMHKILNKKTNEEDWSYA